MPVVPEETEKELAAMDEFINWENTDPAAGVEFNLDFSHLPQGALLGSDPNLDLALENVVGDDFSFWALEHFESSNVTVPTDDILAAEDAKLPLEFWEHPEAPCYRCEQRGYQCKKIREGKFRGYCTSCVALRVGCSLAVTEGPQAPVENFPQNPWPIMGDHPNSIPTEDNCAEIFHSSSAPDLHGLVSAAGSCADADTTAMKPATGPAKVGARFSRESVRILKNWYSTHGRYPYPTDEEKESLQRLTGLNKTQITNWLANYRRRSKVQPTRSTSPHPRNMNMAAIDIPQRRGTPSPLDMRQVPQVASFGDMNPLQRWANSPPEHEPANVTDIARAISASSGVSSSSGLNSPYSFNYTDDGSGRSQGQGSSISSLGTSGSSGGSFASAYSHASRGSLGSFNSLGRGRRRRRRRNAPKAAAAAAAAGVASLAQPLKAFQCTFCTETFRTKHDWQRHEKSLHLSLERWICAPKGPKAFNPEANQIQCVFCGEANPDEVHFETHNHSACQERSLSDRTFYRKDHLRQHLKLVHNVKFINWSMASWQETTAEIRSRCGFCGIVMDTWSFRTDHLAEHFKGGNTMADWKGDWGFDLPVLELVQNSIPPYLIHDERNSPLPFTANLASPMSPIHAYDLLKSELVFFTRNVQDSGREPTDEELQLEACRIVFGSEVLSHNPLSSAPSWLRDLIMSSDQLTLQAQMGPIRGPADSRMAMMRINGKDNIFENCAMEEQLQKFVRARMLLGLTATDSELQVEACNILGRMEESSSSPSELVANFLLRLIAGSKTWLASFRQRAHLPRSEDMAVENWRPKDNTIDSTIHSYSRLETELGEYVRTQRAMGVDPDDADLQRKARIIIYDQDDGWNQTAADSAEWLQGFRDRLAEASTKPHSQASGSPTTSSTAGTALNVSSSPSQLSGSVSAPSGSTMTAAAAATTISPFQTPGSPTPPLPPPTSLMELNYSSMPHCPVVGVTRHVKTSPFFLNDANCYRRLERELSRYVAAATSPNNPSRHVPSDEELQHQARWILYDDDDPWNQTAADNAEWLERFKRDYGIASPKSGPGLPAGAAWAVEQGGTGFAPPYAFPKSAMEPFRGREGGRVPVVELRDGAKVFEAGQRTANKFLETFTTRYRPIAAVFCSRELEDGLTDFVQGEMLASGGEAATAAAAFPSDEALRARARQIQGTDVTAADDPVLLGKFKALFGCGGEGGGEGGSASAAAGAGDAAGDTAGAATSNTPEASSSLISTGEGLDMDMDLCNLTFSQLDEMLLDVNFDDLDDGGAPLLTGSPSQVLG